MQCFLRSAVCRSLSLLIILLSANFTWAAEWYVSPSGSSSGNGSIGNPWNLVTAFNAPSSVQPGDTIWLRGGTYTGIFTSYLNGNSSNPIYVKQYPGERAILKGPPGGLNETLHLNGTYTWFWGFEITSSVTNRVSAQTGSWPTDMDISAGLTTGGGGSGCKLINLIIYDTAQGIQAWNNTVDFEATGCLVYFNGWQAPDRGHGHGCYTQNNTGLKFYQDNIFFANYGNGTQAYGSDAAYVNNFAFENNTYFDNGILATNSSSVELIIGGGKPSQNIVARYNRLYRRNGYIGFDMGDPAIVSMGTCNISGTVENNYLFCGFRVWPFQNGGFTYQYNTVIGPSHIIDLNTHNVALAPTYTWNYNTYYCTETRNEWGNWQPFFQTYTGTTLKSWAQWRSATGYDSNSTYSTTYPTSTIAFVRANPYESGRGNIAVYNWEQTSSVTVDVSSILTVGSPYVVQDVQNYFGPPVATGTYAGGSIAIPMTSTVTAQPAGNPPKAYVHTSKQFGAFIVMRVNAVSNMPPVVSAGVNQSLVLPASAITLAGSVSDDGLPAGAAVAYTWSLVSGPAAVTFGDAAALNSTATFSAVGTYVLRLSASDTALSGSGDVTLTVKDQNMIMVMHLPFDDATGTVAHDSSGNGHNGTLINGPTWVAGQAGGAVHFDEVNDYVEVPNFSYGSEFTISFWFKPDDNAGTLYQYLLSHGNLDAASSINILILEQDEAVMPNRLRTYLRDADDTSYDSSAALLDANMPALDGQWHLYTLTVKAGAGSTVYLDGVAVASDPARGGGTFSPVTALFLGVRADLNLNRLFGGGLDDVRIYNVALTASDVAALVPPAAVPGDFNGDGKVTGQDFLIWQAHYPMESGATKDMGDANGDGMVNGADFLMWQAGYQGKQ